MVKHKGFNYKYNVGDIVVDNNRNNILLLRIEKLILPTNGTPSKQYDVKQIYWQYPMNNKARWNTREYAHILDQSTELAPKALVVLYGKA